MQAVFIVVCFGAWKRHAVVAGDDDQRVVELAGLFQQIEHAPQIPIERFDLGAIVEHVTADRFVVRQKRRHEGISQLFTSFKTGAGLERAMRLFAAEPEAERSILRFVFEEFGEVARVIVVEDSLIDGTLLERVPLYGLPAGFSPRPLICQLPGPQPLAVEPT